MLEQTNEKINIAMPRYVLMDGTTRVGPTVSDDDFGKHCLAIYGFSDKILYDRFQEHRNKKLAPYPLVKGYLSNQLAAQSTSGASESDLKLVVLDATGSDDLTLQAVTMNAVLEAQENRMPQVQVSHQLSFDPETSTYQITNVI